MAVVLTCYMCGCAQAGQHKEKEEKKIIVQEENIVPADERDRGIQIVEQDEHSNDSQSQTLIALAPELQYENEKSENLAGLLQNQAGMQVCRIVAGEIFGSGVLYEVNDRYLYIVTAGHVLAGATDQVYVRFQNDVSIASAKFWQSDDLDLGVVLVSIDDIKNYSNDLLLADHDEKWFNECQSGNGVIAMGAFSSAAGEAYEGKMEDPFIYVEQYGHYMMVARVFCAPGMSGGGLFDAKGHFLGMLCGTNEDGLTAAIPDGEVEIAFSAMQSLY